MRDILLDRKNTTYILCNMKMTTSIKLDKDVKKEASALASQMGLNLSSVVNATLKKFVMERRIVFSLSPEFNVQTEKKLLKIKDDIRKGKNIVGSFDTVDRLRESLMS